jgi:hypothetical protein
MEKNFENSALSDSASPCNIAAAGGVFRQATEFVSMNGRKLVVVCLLLISFATGLLARLLDY